jgi:hypothetical protein
MTDDLTGLFYLLIEKHGGKDRLLEDIDTEWVKGMPVSIRQPKRKRKKIFAPWWEQWQIDYLIDNYQKITNHKIADRVNKSYIQTCSKIGYLRSNGLLPDRDYRGINEYTVRLRNGKDHNKQ